MSSIFVIIMISILLAVVIFLLLVWALRREQFDDMEGPKYRMMDDDDET